jgi:hypothetical protein
MEISRDGQIAHIVPGWECVHCNLKVWKWDVSRLAFHLAGDVGRRDAANGFTGIGLCPEIYSDVADRAKAKIAAKMAKKARKTSLSAAGQVMASDEGAQPPQTRKG